jgi:hypothetical protein
MGNMPRRAKKIAYGTALILFALCCIVPLFCFLMDQLTFVILSTRAGIQPNQRALVQHVNSFIKIGASQQEIHQKIVALTPIYRIVPFEVYYGKNCEDIEVLMSFIVWRPMHWVVCYDNNGKVNFLSTYD